MDPTDIVTAVITTGTTVITIMTATTIDGTDGASTIERSLIGLQTRPDDLRVISRHDVPVGVRGVRPVDGLHLAAVTGIGSRLNQFRPADFPVALR